MSSNWFPTKVYCFHECLLTQFWLFASNISVRTDREHQGNRYPAARNSASPPETFTQQLNTPGTVTILQGVDALSQTCVFRHQEWWCRRHFWNGRCRRIFKFEFCKHFVGSDISNNFCEIALSLMISHYWFRQWLGAVRQQAVTWTNDDTGRHMSSQGHSAVIRYSDKVNFAEDILIVVVDAKYRNFK